MSTARMEVHIHEAMHRLTAAEKRAARAILGNYPTLGLAPVAEFSQLAGASPATVLRFVSKLGFKSYPEFQRALREELEERTKSPLARNPSPAQGEDGKVLDGFFAQVGDNLRHTSAGIPASEFISACQRLALSKQACHLAGGRFTDAIAGYLLAHLRLVRPGMRKLSNRPVCAQDELLDVRPGDTAVIFDIRRYDAELLKLAEQLAAQRVFTILVTDEWISPVSRYAKIVLPCRITVNRTWDSSAALFALVEAMIAQVTSLTWATASKRMRAADHPDEP